MTLTPEEEYKATVVEAAFLGANATIQWKGTNVCMDVHCPCGEHSHLDAEFAYFVRCPKCGVSYKVGERVTLTPMTAVEVAERGPGILEPL